MRERKEEGERLVMAFDLAAVNKYCEKNINQLVTYNSRRRESQTDFLMCQRNHFKELQDNKWGKSGNEA